MAGTSSYWESTDNALPQWLQADPGSAHALGSVAPTLPPSSAWATRSQTLSVPGSSDGHRERRPAVRGP